MSIIELNNDYFCLNDLKMILLLNKNDLSVVKTININSDNLGMLKISSKYMSIFVNDHYNLVSSNYNISSNGIKWTIDQEKTLLNDEKAAKFFQDKNYILFKSNSYDSFFSVNSKYYLYKIEFYSKKNQNYYLDNKYHCILI